MNALTILGNVCPMPIQAILTSCEVVGAIIRVLVANGFYCLLALSERIVYHSVGSHFLFTSGVFTTCHTSTSASSLTGNTRIENQTAFSHVCNKTVR